MRSVKVFSFPHILARICYLCSFDDSHSDRCEVISECGFDLHFPHNQPHCVSFHTPLGHHISSLEKLLFSISIHFLKQVVCFLCIFSCMSCFCWLFFFFFFLKCGPFLKSLLNLLPYCFCFMFWAFGPEACWILAPQRRIEPIPPAVESEVLTTGPSGKSLLALIPIVHIMWKYFLPFSVVFSLQWFPSLCKSF